MLRKSKALILCLMLCIGLLVPFESNAADTYYVDYNKPVCSENSGYLNLIMRDRVTGDDVLMTFYWSISPYSQTHNSDVSSISSTHMTLYIANRGIVEFWPKCAGSVKASVSIMFYSGNASYEQAWVNDTISSGEVTKQYILNWSELYTIEGFQVFGNYGNVNADFMSPFFTVVYGESKEEIDAIDENTTWLQKIFNALKDSREEEKEAAQSQAGQSSSDAQASIEDKSAGFVDSVNGLASSMSYSGTECAWSFPALYLPEIPGVMSRTQLTSEQPIDFAYWVNQIPSNLLLLVRSVLTIALIGYCFKEFYGVIEYVLTMRGGGNSE